MRNSTSKRRSEQTRKLAEMLGGQCEKCGYSGNLAALDFHHRDLKKKDGPVGWFINFHRFELAVKEAKKCQLLCKNCHHELHYPHLDLERNEKELRFTDDSMQDIQQKCDVCGKYSGGQTFCSQDCSKLGQRKVKNRPFKSQLKKLLGTMSYCALGRKFGVSDNAVRKWAKGYGLVE
ncbi:MAG: HNH endonuclease signature motif containing protein [Promethearchaeota archaeon]|jgi:hypothetical protein